jgi:hypothetical protein
MKFPRLFWILILLLGFQPMESFAIEDEEVEEEQPRFIIRVQGAPSLGAYQLSGSSGFSTTLPLKFGYFAGLDFTYSPRDSALTFRLTGRHSTIIQDGLPASITPSTVQIHREQIGFGFLFAPFRESSGIFSTFKAGISYQVIGRFANNTSPNTLVSSALTHGLGADVFWDGKLGRHFKFETGVNLTLPFYFREITSSSGSHSLTLSTRGHFTLIYPLTQVLSIGIGFDARLDWFQYAGSGTRGTVDAHELDNAYGVPVEIRFEF